MEKMSEELLLLQQTRNETVGFMSMNKTMRKDTAMRHKVTTITKKMAAGDRRQRYDELKKKMKSWVLTKFNIEE